VLLTPDLPTQIAVDQSTGKVYISNWANSRQGDVSVIDEASDTITDTIPLDLYQEGTGIATDPQTDMIYVGVTPGVKEGGVNTGTTGVSVIDGSTDRIVATVPVGSSGGQTGTLAVNPLTDTIYVTELSGDFSGYLYVIDGFTDTVSTAVELGSAPDSVAVDPSTDTIYVGSQGGTSVSIIDGATNTIMATLNPDSGDTFGSPAVDTSTNLTYISETGATDEILEYNVATLTNSFEGTSALIQQVGIDPVTDTLYYTNANGSSSVVTVVDGANGAIITTIPDGQATGGVAPVGLDPSTGTVYVGNQIGYQMTTVSVIDEATNAIIATIPQISQGPP
jgi:DNA-binding beta-propeller fold protein YncE